MQKLIALLIVSFLFACTSLAEELTPSQAEKEFFRQSTAVQMRRFDSLDIEQQYRLLVIGNQVIHPPALYLTERFAKRGAEGGEFLVGKLASTKSETSIRDIVAVFAEMQRSGTSDVRSNAKAMALIQAQVSSMKGQWALTTRRMVEEIQSAPGK